MNPGPGISAAVTKFVAAQVADPRRYSLGQAGLSIAVQN